MINEQHDMLNYKHINTATMNFVDYRKSMKTVPDKQTKQFSVWLKQVEKNVFDRLGYKLLDLPDEPYMVWFENGRHVNEVVDDIVNSFNDMYLFVSA